MPTLRHALAAPLLTAPLLAAAWVTSCSEYDTSLLHFTLDASVDAPADVSAEAPADSEVPSDSAPEAEADAPAQDSEAEADAPDDAPADALEDPHEDVDPRACDQCKDLGLVRPPCPHPGSDPTPATAPLVFAARTVRAAALPTDDIGAWRNIGYDLDCLLTPPGGTPGSCTPLSLSTPLTEDGLEGRDNSFARNLSGQIRLLIGYGIFPDVQGQAASRLDSGLWGWVFVLDQYAGGDDDPQVRLSVYQSAGTVDSGGSPTQPSWDGQDRWSIESDQVDSLGSPVHVDSAAFVADGTVVARLPATVPLSLRAAQVRLQVPVQQVLVTMHLTPDRNEVDWGLMAGAVRATSALQAFDALAAQAGVCLPHELYSGARNVIASSGDLRQDAPQEPAASCDSLSVGVEFTAHRALLGPVTAPQPFVVPSCPDAGP